MYVISGYKASSYLESQAIVLPCNSTEKIRDITYSTPPPSNHAPIPFNVVPPSTEIMTQLISIL